MSRQFLRKVGLTVVQGEDALDLSQMRIKFRTTQLDAEGGYPPGAWIRVFNLSAETAKRVENEYQRVILQAGYEGGDYGVIFDGTIKQIRRGRFNQTTTFLDIMAADSDLMRYACMNETLAAGWQQPDVAKAVETKLSEFNIGTNTDQVLGGIVAPRGKVMFGLAETFASGIGRTQGSTWSIQEGKLVWTPLSGYREGEVVVLNANTGLIGVPEATIDGIEGLCLLNPKLNVGHRVQIDNASINTTTVKEPGYPRFGDRPYFASLAADGYYRAIVVEHFGDTRGQEWYTSFNCLAIDPSAAPDESVQPYGYQGVP